MKNSMNRFNVNDSIQQLKRNTVIRKGTVIAGPFNVEGVSHYHVKWEWECPQEATSPSNRKPNELDLICDMISTKYMYV